ncbi:MAG TPA: hypothetical protein VK662_16505 [Acidothermaceae bacterium]|nr:hypothetical protein [Acidothermaceae bacterium]
MSAIAFGATAAPQAPASNASAGSIGIRLLDVPANEANDPRARLYIVEHVAPGAVIERRVAVSNTTSSAVTVALYAAAATIDSGSFIGDAGHTANDVSSWTSITPAAPQIPAGGTATAMVTIAVPTAATSGEKYAVVWAEVRTAAGSGVTEVSRVGVRIYLSVGSGVAPAANFTIGSVTAERSAQGNPVVVASVHNTGGLALDMSGTLQLSAGPGGLSAGPFPAALGVTLAIGSTEPVTITLSDVVPTGPWLARITLQSGLTQRSAQATIAFPASGTSAPVKAVGPNGKSHRTVIIATIAAALLVMVGAALLLLHRRRPTRGWPEPYSTSATAPTSLDRSLVGAVRSAGGARLLGGNPQRGRPQ